MFATAAICSRRIGVPPSFAEASLSASVMERWPGTGGSFVWLPREPSSGPPRSFGLKLYEAPTPGRRPDDLRDVFHLLAG
ncbi:hypothetical protein ALMP_15370 [Streptomyces sp. A012304]|nr:hypothetical protein ALMP_15370 [Streptomyces sp. A012304]